MLLSLSLFAISAYLSLFVVYPMELVAATVGVCVSRIVLWAIACVTAVIAVDEYYSASFQMMGYVTQKSFVDPWAAVTLGEFWGKRWFGAEVVLNVIFLT